MFPTSKLSPFFWFTQQLHLLVKTAYRRERGQPWQYRPLTALTGSQGSLSG
jgi:hypothetical protein